MLLRASHPLTLFALLILPACGKKLVTTTLTPSFLESENSGKFDEGCWTPLLGSTLKPIPGQTALFGYYNPDIGQGIACRVFVKFDFASLPNKNVVAAELHWAETTQRAEGGSAANSPPCEKTMFVAKEPWTKFLIAGEQLTKGSSPVQVGVIVREWVNGKRANEGFFFVGQEEKILQGNKDYCFSMMKVFQLDVTSAVPADKWP